MADFSVKNLRFGFSVKGLLAVALVMLPNLLSLFLAPPNDVLAQNAAGLPLWDVLENIGRFGTMLSLVFLVNRRGETGKRSLRLLAAAFLLAYYVGWLGYFLGVTNGFLLVGLALFPTLFFFTSAFVLRNTAAIGFSVLFGLVHVGITAGNYLL